jgi:hypothetical protein
VTKIQPNTNTSAAQSTRSTPATTESAAAPTSADATPSSAQADKHPGGPDAFDSDGPVTSSGAIQNLRADAPRGDAQLANEARTLQAQQNAGGIPGRRAPEPRVADGPAAAGGTTASGATQAQQAFVTEMQGRGVQASQPPTPAQLRQYFGTFNNRADRPQALTAYQRYSDAYHVHAAQAGRGNTDVQYSRETHYVLNGNTRRMFTSRADAERAAEPMMRRGRDVTIDTIPTRDASSWNDVLRSDQHQGRHVNDCEGFAYTAQELLGAAGYRSEQVSMASDNQGYDHAVTVLRDPARARQVHVASNGDITSGRAGRAGETALLNQAYTDAGGQGSTTLYRGSTQAQARMQYARLYP